MDEEQIRAALAVPFALYNFMPTASGTCYAGSRATGDTSRHDMDICALKMRPGDTTIRSLGAPINTTGFEGDFFVAKDESYIIVSTKETKDFESELWISFHKMEGNWTPLVSLGDPINHGLAHRWGQYVSPDGKYLFFSLGHSPADCRIHRPVPVTNKYHSPDRSTVLSHPPPVDH